jgi:predicted small secreted protein
MKLLFLSLTTIFALSSCNTMIGLGRDTRLLGQGLENVAEKAAPSSPDSYDTGGSGAPVY